MTDAKTKNDKTKATLKAALSKHNLEPYAHVTDAKADPKAAFEMLKLPREAGQKRTVTLRGVEVEFYFHILSMHEAETAKLAGMRYLKEKQITPADIGDQNFADKLGDACAAEILAVSLCLPEPSENGHYLKAFGDANQIRLSLTPDEFAKLFNVYLQVTDEVSGLTRYAEMIENIEQWIDLVANGAELSDFLAGMPSALARELCTVLAVALQSIRRSLPEQFSNSLESLKTDGLTESISSEPSSSTEDVSKPAKKTKAKGPELLSPSEAESLAEGLF